jgi:outer membrane protein OmpA-like peptidoglycan-associated protein
MSAWRTGLIIAGMAAFGIVGSQSKVAQENRALWQQNRELQPRYAEAHSQPTAEPAELAQLQAQIAARDQQLEALRAKQPATRPAPEASIAGLQTSFNKTTGDMTVTVPGDVLFDAGRATLKESSKATLTRLAQAIRSEYAGKHVFVDGYTDTDPVTHSKSMWRDNLDLSAARARAVANYLQTQGVSAQNLEIRAFGPARPKATKQASRRVELVVATR